MSLIDWFAVLAGVLTVGGTLVSVVKTLVVPRRAWSLVPRAVDVSTAWGFMIVARRMRSYDLIDRWLGFLGPVLELLHLHRRAVQLIADGLQVLLGRGHAPAPDLVLDDCVRLAQVAAQPPPQPGSHHRQADHDEDELKNGQMPVLSRQCCLSMASSVRFRNIPHNVPLPRSEI